jgi:hypothetical protein
MSGSRQVKAGALTFLTAAIVGVGVLAGAGGGSARVSAPQWQTVPGVNGDEIQFAVWAAGRLWIGALSQDGATRLVSGRVAGGRLSAWVTTKLSFGSFGSFPGISQGEYRVRAGTGADGITPDVKAVKLLPNGKVSGLIDLGGAPAPRSSGPTIIAQLPDRIVLGESITVGQGTQERHHAGACCDVNGKPVDWNSFLPYGAFARFGIDRQGRLWLAWYVPTRPDATMVELDTATLKPRGRPVVAPGPTQRIDDMVCADRCRLVIEGNYRDRRPTANHFWSWAPGERSVTQLKVPGGSPGAVAQLVGARDYGGRLVVAYQGIDVKSNAVIGVARGDARGGGLRVIRSITAPYNIGSTNDSAMLVGRSWGPGSGWGVGAAFGPNGFAAVLNYDGFIGHKYGKGLVRVAILSL